MRALFFASIAAVVSSCSPRPGALPSTPDSTPPASAATSPSAGPATTLGDEGCTRGDATPALDATKVAGHSFSRGLGPRAEETGTLADGTRVRVRHLGCEHYVERYTFTLAKGSSITDGKQWAARAKELLAALPFAADRAKAREDWIAALTKAAPTYELRSPIALEHHASLQLEARSTGAGSELDVIYDAAR